MKHAALASGAVLLLSASFACAAEDFVFEVAAPKFKVTLPNIPQIKMDTHPLNASQPHLRYLGSNGPYTVAVFTPTAAAGMTPIECASAIVKTMSTRRGLPHAADLYKLRLNDNTFVTMYTTPLGGGAQLHAHFMSAIGGTHCIEVHASKMSTSDDDLAPWFEGFGKARFDTD